MTDFKIIHLPSIDSTNNYVKSLDETTSGDNLIVLADEQTCGRGSGRNSWESEKEKNLTFSILIHPTFLQPKQQFLLSMAISNAISETIDGSCIKWPNDIYVGDRKICGILFECKLQGNCIKDCIIGIGLNVNQTVFVSNAPNPTSLKLLTGKEWDKELILSGIINNFQQQVKILQNHQETAVRNQYLSRLYRKNGFFPFRDSQGIFSAKIHDIEDDGRIVLHDTANRLLTYSFKELEFIIKS